MWWLRVHVFPDKVVGLSYGLPLLLCLWHRDLRLLWAMAAAFIGIAVYKAAVLLPVTPDDYRYIQLVMQVVNIAVLSTILQMIIHLNTRLRKKNADLEQTNEELSAREEEINRQNEELQSQAEELAHQNEEIHNQSEEVRVANSELDKRHRMLEMLLAAIRGNNDEHLLEQVCKAAIQLLPAATAASVVEKEGDELIVRASANMSGLISRNWSFKQSFASIVVQHNRTAFVQDLLQRTDLIMPRPKQQFRSILASPLRLHGKACGAVEVYSEKPRDWTTEEFRIIEWVAAQCSLVLEAVRLHEELRRSERRWRELADQMPNSVWECDAQGQNYYQNRFWYEYVGAAVGTTPGSDWLSFYHPEDRDYLMGQWTRSLQNPARPYDIEVRIRRRDGVYRWFRVIGTPVRDESGKVLKWVGTCTDIDERKQAEAALLRAKDQLAVSNSNLEQTIQNRTSRLQELVNELEHFSYTITHDMRAPLRAMQGYAALLTEETKGLLPPQSEEYLRRIGIAAARMDRLIIDALSYSRAVQQDIVLEPIDPEKLLRGMIDSYPVFQPPRATIEFDSKLHAVHANEAGLTQCFSNILGNAIKFVEKDTVPHIRIRSEEKDGFVRLCFHDNGIGIPEEMQPRIFGMFQRISKDYEGTGIGLALVRKVTERMGGRVGVDSEPGKGSCFWLELKKAK